MPKPRSHSNKDLPIIEGRIHKPKRAKTAAKLHLRSSYPLWVALLLGAVFMVGWLYVAYALRLNNLYWAIGAGCVVALTALWRHDSNGALRSRKPPKGWKSEIRPKKLVNMTLADFDGMRFELIGDDEDDLDQHEVPWASRRYSREEVFWIRVMFALIPVCVAGAIFVPHITIHGSGASLPHTYNVKWYWICEAALLLMAACVSKYIWDNARLLVQDDYISDILEGPTWFPWIPGKNNPIPISYVWRADPVDSWWGKRWEHGTVMLTVSYGFNPRTIKYKRVPRHREYCIVVNGMVRGPIYGPGMV